MDSRDVVSPVVARFMPSRVGRDGHVSGAAVEIDTCAHSGTEA
ncbi:hypothetical protein ACVW00_000822 [Marmoricola sp. URHA0025 HA25]